jgi:hypothetical protein
MKRPDVEIGPPPPLVAATGRMNAHGISVFYGATDPLVALAVVRPPVGSKVVIAHFEFLRTVRLLDVEALRAVDIRLRCQRVKGLVIRHHRHSNSSTEPFKKLNPL